VSLLIAGYDHEGPQLYQVCFLCSATLLACSLARLSTTPSCRSCRVVQVDPSGSYWAWKASAIGKNATNAKTFLEKRYLSNPDMELEDAINTAILTLKEGFEGIPSPSSASLPAPSA
jgi:20S proteasome alpha/beta subunit